MRISSSIGLLAEEGLRVDGLYPDFELPEISITLRTRLRSHHVF